MKKRKERTGNKQTKHTQTKNDQRTPSTKEEKEA